MWLRPALLGLRLHRGLAALLVLAVVLLVTLRRLSVARGARVAVVLYGTRFHRLELTGASIARAIPPTADVFVFGHDQLDAAQHVKAAFGSRVVHMHLQSQLPARAVQAMLDAMRSPPSEDPLKVRTRLLDVTLPSTSRAVERVCQLHLVASGAAVDVARTQ